MNVEINNVSSVKEEKYNYKGNSDMIDDDPIDEGHRDKKKDNPFELVSDIIKNNSNSLNISGSKNSNSSRKSDFSTYGRLSVRMRDRLSRFGEDDDILIDLIQNILPI